MISTIECYFIDINLIILSGEFLKTILYTIQIRLSILYNDHWNRMRTMNLQNARVTLFNIFNFRFFYNSCNFIMFYSFPGDSIKSLVRFSRRHSFERKTHWGRLKTNIALCRKFFVAFFFSINWFIGVREFYFLIDRII